MFMDDLIKSSEDIWQQCAEQSFIKDLANQTLSRQRFLEYLIQDSIYLKDYIKAHALAMYKSQSLREMRAFYSILSYVNDSENITRLKYLADYNLTDEDIERMDKNPACKNYTEFLLNCAQNQDIPEILMAFLPCMLGYYAVFKIVNDKYPKVLNSYFGDLVKDYVSDDYKKQCDYWLEFTGDICKNLSDQRKADLKKIYLQSSLYELEFWNI